MNLFVLTNNPERASFKQRVETYLDILRKNGINCRIAKLPTGIWARRKLFEQAKDFDAVFLHKKCLNILDAFWLRKYSRKIIYNFDDAIMYDDKRPDRDSRVHFRRWKRSVGVADRVIVGSEYLAEYARRFNSNVEVLPIGLKVSDYHVPCLSKPDNNIRLVWIGSKSTLDYLVEIKPVLEEIGGRYDNVILRIICDDFFDLKNMPVEKRLWSSETRGIDLAACDIGLAPLPDNRFTQGKCSFKVLEYSAAGLPVVASPVGTNSEYVREGITGFLATDTQKWVERISQLVENPQLCKKMGEQGRAWAKNFDVSVIGKQLCELIAKCVGI